MPRSLLALNDVWHVVLELCVRDGLYFAVNWVEPEDAQVWWRGGCWGAALSTSSQSHHKRNKSVIGVLEPWNNHPLEKKILKEPKEVNCLPKMPSALRKWQSFLQGRMDLCLCVVWLKHPASLLLWRIPNPRQAQHVPCGGQSRRQLCWASYWKVRHVAAVPGRDLWGALTLLCPPACKQGLKRGLMWNPIACASQQLFVRPD